MSNEPDSNVIWLKHGCNSVVGRVRLNDTTWRIEDDSRFPIFYDPICEKGSEGATRRAIEEWQRLESMVTAPVQQPPRLADLRPRRWMPWSRWFSKKGR